MKRILMLSALFAAMNFAHAQYINNRAGAHGNTHTNHKIQQPKKATPQKKETKQEILNITTGTATFDESEGDYQVSSLKSNHTTAVPDDAPTTYIDVEQTPTFPGGDEALLRYIATHIKYPALAQELEVEGQIVLKFVVTESGSVDEVQVTKGLYQDIEAMSMAQYTRNHPAATAQEYETYLARFNNERSAEKACEAEAARVVKTLPRFIPGKLQGKPVRAWYSLPIRFQLQ